MSAARQGAFGLISVLLLAPPARPAAGIPMESVVPDQVLAALDGAPRNLRALRQAPVTVLFFLSAQCPISNGYVARMNELAQEQGSRATFLGINSNSNETPQDAGRHAADYRLAFPVYKDPGNVLADLLGITLTPEAVLLDGDHRLRYRGRIDDHRNPARVASTLPGSL